MVAQLELDFHGSVNFRSSAKFLQIFNKISDNWLVLAHLGLSQYISGSSGSFCLTLWLGSSWKYYQPSHS